jgi:outer membrane lipoprotein SlyB
MSRLLIFIGMIVGGYVGWFAGDYMGLGLMTTFLVSTLGSIAGVYVGWRIMRDYLERGGDP